MLLKINIYNYMKYILNGYYVFFTGLSFPLRKKPSILHNPEITHQQFGSQADRSFCFRDLSQNSRICMVTVLCSSCTLKDAISVHDHEIIELSLILIRENNNVPTCWWSKFVECLIKHISLELNTFNSVCR